MFIDHMLSFTIQMLMFKAMKNLPFIMIFFSLSTILFCIPTMFLCRYQFARKIPFYCYCRKQHILSIFLDTFQGYYKDGTKGTYDWRFLSGLYLIFRIVFVYYVHKHNLLPRNATPPQMLYYIIITVIVVFVKPYKRFIHNLTETLLLILIVYMVWNASAFLRIAYS